MMLRQGTIIVAVGLVIGVVGPVAAAKLVSNLLVISGTDPATYAVVSAVLTLAALAACYIPARRTMRVDPMVALRYEWFGRNVSDADTSVHTGSYSHIYGGQAFSGWRQRTK